MPRHHTLVGRYRSVHSSLVESASQRLLRCSRVAACLAAACAPLTVIASPVTFDGNAPIGNTGDNATFNDPNNWTTNGAIDVAPSTTAAPGDDLTFGGGTPGIIDLQSNRFANSLTFNAGYTLGTAATALTFTDTSGAVVVAPGVTGTMNAVLAGGNGLNVSGGGTLVLARAGNTFTGNVTVDGAVAGTALSFFGGGNADQTALGAAGKSITLINGGILRVALASADPNNTGNKSFVIGTGGGSFDVGSGLTFTLNDGTNLASLTSGNPAQLQGTGDLTKVGAGTLVLGQAVTTSFNGNNFTGNLIINAGRVQAFGTATGSTPLGTTAGNTQIYNTGVLDLQANTAEAIVIGGNNPSGSLIVGAGAGTAASVTLATPTGYLGGTGTLTVGVIGDGGNGYGINKVGAGALVLTAAPTYSGTTTIAGGALRLTNAAFQPAKNILLAGGAIETNYNLNPTLGTGAGQFNVGSGASGFSANGAPVTVNVNGSGQTLAFGATPNFAPDALLLNQTTANNAITLANGLDLNGATRIVTVANTAGTNTATISGAIVNTVAGSPAGLTKNGSGTLVLANAANAYDGPTTIAGGALRATDGASLPSTNLVLNGGAFETSGTFARSLGTGNSQVQFPGANGGFSAFGAPLTVDVGGDGTGTGPQLAFGVTPNFFPTTNAATLTLNEGSANNALTFRNSLNLGGGAAVVTRNVNVNANTATLAGFITQNSGTAGAGITKGGGGTLILANGTNNFTGTLAINAGVVNVASVSDYGVPSALGARTFAQESSASNDIIGLLFNGGTLQYTGATPQSTNRQIRVGTSGAIFDASGANPNATLSFTGASGANINLFQTAGARTFTLTGSNTGTNTFAIQLTNQGTNATSLTKTGLGTWVLAGTNNTFTGNVTVSAGNLRIANAAALGAGPKTISIIPTSNPSSLPALQLDGSLAPIALPANLSFTTSYDALNNNVPIPGAGAVVNLAGNNSIAGNFSMPSGGGGTTIFANAGTLTLSGNFTPTTTSRTLFSRGNGNTVFSGVIANGSTTTGMPFTRGTGTGITTMTGANTYTGTTTVNAGALLVNGVNGTAAAPQFNYAVTAADGLGGATLGGSGTINLAANQSVAVNGLPSVSAGRSNNATLSPGAAPGAIGTLTVAAAGAGASVNFGANSTFAVDLGPANAADRVTLTGAANNLTLAGSTAGPAAGTSDALALSTADTGTFTIASYTGARSGVFDFVTLNGVDDPGAFSVAGPLTTFTAADNSLSVLYDDNNQNVVLTVNSITVTPTPEPTTALLLLPAAAGVLGRRRRRHG